MRTIASLLVVILLAGTATAQDQKKFASANDEIAFDGNDLVSYFNEGGPTKGKSEFTYQYEDLKLRFASKVNLDKFKKDPSKYLPEYNGWCAIALTHGSWIRPDFNEFKVQDGRLLFFEVRAFYNGRTAWEKDPDINKIVADRKYKELTKSR